MNRHHPYSAPYDGHSRRGGSSPGGAGPDRSHRYQDRGGIPFRGRGGYNNRGRGGGYSSYDGANMSNAYDQSHSQPYSDYEAPPPGPSAYFQSNNSYGDASHYNGASGYEGYDKYEDQPPAQGYGTDDYNRRPRNVRKDRDDKVHDSIIEERIQRERPCRTLFIRNIKYETSSDDVRALFEEHGEIKTFFDLIATRGMVFVTYFDLRAAERARDRLQGSEISGRPIDVHYSLPRDDQRGAEREKNQQMQGVLQCTLRSSPTGQPIDEGEVRRKFQASGDLKAVRPVGERIDSVYVEFYDMRACHEAFDRLRHQNLQDGVMDLVLAWDDNDNGGYNPGQSNGRDHGGHRNQNWEERGPSNSRGHRGRGRGGRGGRGGRNQGDDGGYDREPYGRDNRRWDDGGYGRDNRGGDYDRHNDSRGGYGPPPSNYPPPSIPPGPPGPYGPPHMPPPPPSAVSPPDDRLDQARKVQQLLAALKQPQSGPNGTATPPNMPPGGTPGPPPPNIPYYSQPPGGMPPYPGSMPPPSTYSGGLPPVPTPPPVSGGASGLPPNIMALLQQAQSRPPGPPSASPYGMPPGPPPPTGVPPAQYQQLMSYLSQAQPPK